MNPLHGQRLFAVSDPLAVGFTDSQLADAMYELTASDEQEALMLETESFSVMDSCYIAGEPVVSGLVLDAVTTSFARFPRVMQALQRALNRGADVKVLEHEIGTPKKNNMFATVAVQFKLSDGQVLSVVFHAPDEDPKVFKPDDMVVAFRWLLNKRDITQVVTPEMSQGKMKDVSLTTVAKRVGSLIAANSSKFTAKQDEVAAAKKALEDIEVEKDKLRDELAGLTNDIAEISESKETADKVLQTKKQGLQDATDYNEKLRARVAELQASQPDVEPDQVEDVTPEPNPILDPQPESVTKQNKNESSERLELIDSKLHRDITSSMSTIAAIDQNGAKGRDRALFVSSIVNKVKTKHKNQQQEVVDAALDYIDAMQEGRAKPLITKRNGVWKLHSNASGTPEEKVQESEQPEPDKPEAVTTLEAIINGVHDDVNADDILEMIEEAAEQLESLGLVEEYDALIGSAAEKYAELDEKQE